MQEIEEKRFYNGDETDQYTKCFQRASELLIVFDVRVRVPDRNPINKMSLSTSPSSESAIRCGGHRDGNILEFYAQEFKPEPSPADLFRQRVIQWFFAAKHLRYFETSRLTEKPTPEDLAIHRMVCSALITFGEFASNFARRLKGHGDFAAVGLSVESVESETRLLRNNFQMFHDHTMSPSEAEAVLKEAFHET